MSETPALNSEALAKRSRFYANRAMRIGPKAECPFCRKLFQARTLHEHICRNHAADLAAVPAAVFEP